MGSRIIDIVIKATDQASKKLEGVSTVGIAGVAAAAGAAAVAIKKLGDAFSRLTELAGAQEDADLKLAFALRSVGETSDKAFQDAKKFASGLQRVTRFGDETIEQVQGLLAVLGRLEGDSLNRTTRATLDLATALDLDLTAAAQLMARAAQGATESLSRYGLILDENIPKSDKFASLLSLIETNMGGAAQAAAETYAGKIEQLTNNFGDLLEAMGMFVTKAPATEGILNALSRAAGFWADALSSASDAMNKLSQDGGNILEQRLASLREEQQRLIQGILKLQKEQPNNVIAMKLWSEGLQAVNDEIVFVERNLKKVNEAIKATQEDVAAILAANEQIFAQLDRARQGQKDQPIPSVPTPEEQPGGNLPVPEEDKDPNAAALAAFEAFTLAKAALDDEVTANIIANIDATTKAEIDAENKKRGLAERNKRQKQANFSQLASATSAFLTNSFSQSKAAAIAAAIINTAEGVSKALAQGGIFGIALGAIVAAAGAAQIAKITATEFAQGGLVTGGVPGRDSVPALLTPGEFVVPAPVVQQARGGTGAAASFIFNIQGGGGADARSIPQDIRDLADEISALVERGGLRLVSSHVLVNGVPTASSRL